MSFFQSRDKIVDAVRDVCHHSTPSLYLALGVSAGALGGFQVDEANTASSFAES